MSGSRVVDRGLEREIGVYGIAPRMMNTLFSSVFRCPLIRVPMTTLGGTSSSCRRHQALRAVQACRGQGMP